QTNATAADVAPAQRYHGGYHSPVWSAEANRTGSGALGCKSTLVYQPMVIGAELNEVAELGGPSPGPVLDVMSMEEPGVGASWKAAAAISTLKGPSHCRGHGPLPATHRQRTAVTLDDSDHGGVAAQPPNGLRRKHRPSIELRARLHLVRGKRLSVDMHYEFAWVPRGAGTICRGECAPGMAV